MPKGPYIGEVSALLEETRKRKKAGKAEPGDLLTPEGEIKHPFVLEFLGLRDEYSESDDFSGALYQN